MLTYDLKKAPGQPLYESLYRHIRSDILCGVLQPGEKLPSKRALAAQGGWIIEDDYDSEFRFASRPKPAMQTLDWAERVIYMNTFSKTLAPSIRISYMVLPAQLMERFRQQLGFYSCTVPSFEQYTLERFLSRV